MGALCEIRDTRHRGRMLACFAPTSLVSPDKGYICKQPCGDIKQWREGKPSRKLWVLVTLCRVSSFFFFRFGEDGEENESADREE